MNKRIVSTILAISLLLSTNISAFAEDPDIIENDKIASTESDKIPNVNNSEPEDSGVSSSEPSQSESSESPISSQPLEDIDNNFLLDINEASSTPADNEVTEDKDIGNSDITIKVTGEGGTTPEPVPPTDILVATVPAELPIVMDMEGNITVPTAAAIVNNTKDKGIEVSAINIAMSPEWSPAEWTDTFKSRSVGTKEVALSFRGDPMSLDGSVALTPANWKISRDGSLPILMNVKIPKQDTEYEEKLATISFTIGWSGDDSENGGSSSDTVIVSFTAEDGTIEGNNRVVIPKGGFAAFPTVVSTDFTKEFDKWVDNATNTEITADTPIEINTVIKAIFKTRAESPKNWFTASGNTITGLSTEYLNLVDAPTDLVIPSNLGGTKITTIGDNALKGKDLITSVVLPEGLEQIGVSSFDGCRALTNINIPSSVKSIASTSFSSCIALKELSLSHWGPYGIANYPFGLPNPDIIVWGSTNDWDTNPMSKYDLSAQGLELINDAQRVAVRVKVAGNLPEVLKFPTSVDGQRVVHISAPAVSDPTYAKVKSVEIPDTVVSLGDGVFKNFKSLQSVKLSSNITTISKDAFYSCQALVDIDLANVDIVNDSAFYACNAVQNLDISKVTKLGVNSFSGCNKANIILPTTITAIPDGCFMSASISPRNSVNPLPDGILTVGKNAFKYSSGIEELTIPTSLTSLGVEAFSGCSSLKSVTINHDFSWIRSAGTSSSASYVDNYNGAFWACSALETITFGGSTTRMSREPKAFGRCSKIKEINLSPAITVLEGFADSAAEVIRIPEGITTIWNECFRNSSSSTRIILPSTLTTIKGYVFADSSFKSIIIPKSVMTIEGQAFGSMTGLSIFFEGPERYILGKTDSKPWGATAPIMIWDYLPPVAQTESKDVTSAELSTMGLYNPLVDNKNIVAAIPNYPATIEKVYIPKSVDGVAVTQVRAITLPGLSEVYIPDTVVDFYDPFVKDVKTLTKIVLPKTVNAFSIIFSNTPLLKEINLPDNITTIRANTFLNSGIERITLPSAVKSIQATAFKNCANLKEISIPTATETIDVSAFTLTSGVTININKPKDSIAGAPWGATNATINWLG